MKKEFRFVDKNFKFLPNDHAKEDRFAILIEETSIQSCREDGKYNHKRVRVYLSAIPFAKDMSLAFAYAYVGKFARKNSNCLFARLISIEEIEAINEWGRFYDFKIERAKTSSQLVDWHGRVDGNFCWEGEKKFDDETNTSNVYLCFMLDADAEQELVFY